MSSLSNEEKIVQLLPKFHQGVITFLDTLLAWLPNNADLLHRRLITKEMEPQVVITLFYRDFHQGENDEEKERYFKFICEKVKAKDANFLLDPRYVLKHVDSGNSNAFKTLWYSPVFTYEHKDKIWSWITFFVKCIKIYKKCLGFTVDMDM